MGSASYYWRGAFCVSQKEAMKIKIPNPFRIIKEVVGLSTAITFRASVTANQEKGLNLENSIKEAINFFRYREPFSALDDQNVDTLYYFSSMATDLINVVSMVLQHCDNLQSIHPIQDKGELVSFVYSQDVRGNLLQLISICEEIIKIKSKNNLNFGFLEALLVYLSKQPDWKYLTEDEEKFVFLYLENKVVFPRKTNGKEMAKKILLTEFRNKRIVLNDKEKPEDNVLLKYSRLSIVNHFDEFFDACFENIKR